MSFHSFLLSFIPIFVAVDAFGVLPIFISLTDGMSDRKRLKVLKDSVITALIIGIVFIFLGKAIFLFLSITVNDFLIAGGIILFILSVVDGYAINCRPRSFNHFSYFNRFLWSYPHFAFSYS